MTRRERRQAEREGKLIKTEATYTFTATQIEQIKRDAIEEANKQLKEIAEKAKQDATNKAIKMLFALPSVVLHDKFGFGQLRLDRFLQYIQTWIKAIDEDPGTLGELMELAETETGYKILLDGEVVAHDDEGKTASVQAS